MRYPMRLDPPWRPLLALFGGTPGRSFVELTPKTVRFRFGWAFDRTLAHAEIAGAQRVRWPLWWGIGWRLAPGGTVGLIGSRRGVVAVRLRHPRWMRLLFIPWRCHRICVSLEDPDGFVRALNPPP